MKKIKNGEFKFILRNSNKKKGKVLYVVYTKELLYDRVRKIANTIDNYIIDDYSFIDLERNGKLLKTIYAWDGNFSYSDFNEMENYCNSIR